MAGATANLLNFSADQRKVFVVLRWHCMVTHGIEDAEMFKYKKATRPEFVQQLAYEKELEDADVRTLAELIREYKIAGKIMSAKAGDRVEV